MDRIHSYEYIEEQINNSQTMTNSEKENYLKTYKTNYYAWLDELKNKLDNYQPLFNDLDIRRSISPSFNYSEHNLKGEIWKEFPIDKDWIEFTFDKHGQTLLSDK